MPFHSIYVYKAKERRIKQDQERVAREQQQQKEMEAHVIAKACLADITKIVFTDFKSITHFSKSIFDRSRGRPLLRSCATPG